MEKRLTRRSAGESLSKSFLTSRDSPLNMIKEEPTTTTTVDPAPVIATTSSKSKSASKTTSESIKQRRSEPIPTNTTSSEIPNTVTVVEPSSDQHSLSALDNQEKRSSRRIKDQKTVVTSIVSSSSSKSNLTIKTEQQATEVNPSAVSTTTTPTIKFDLGGPTEPTGDIKNTDSADAGSNSIAGNLKMITRRRSSNLLRSGTTSSSAFLTQSLNLGKKRTLSNSLDLSSSLKLNNEPSSSYLDYEENSNSSSVYALPSATSTSNATTNTISSSSSKRLKSKQTTSVGGMMLNSPRPKDDTKMGEEENQSMIGGGDEAMDQDDVVDPLSLKCPIRDCDSCGNLDGVSERHWTFDSCPRYFGINQDECAERRVKLDKLSDEIDTMTKRTNENKKNLRHRYMNKEQLEYFKVVDLQLKNKVKSMHQSSGDTQQQVVVSKPVSILSNLSASYPNLINDVKNLTTSFIIQSSLAHVAPAQASNNLLKPNPLISALTGLNKVDHAPSIDDLDVSEFDLNLFKDLLVMSASQKVTDPLSSGGGGVAEKTLKLLNKNNKLIQFGNFEIETWYKSPYPDDVWQLGKMYICQYCLSYMKAHTVLDRHLEKCVWRHPPGREIYRQAEYSFFEVDGKYNKIYCQNLCLLAKLFLDHKTLYYDVEPFLFYILTKYDERSGSFEMMGYFSKEKQSVMNYNLSCILILPPYMNMSYGRLLIDFSYLLSRVEEKLGSPEKPLSDLGLVSYRSYWKSKLLEYLGRRMDDCEVSIKEISHETGILTNDIISTFQYIGLIKYWKGKHIIIKDKELLDKYIKKQYTYMNVDAAYLRWTPYVYQTIIDESESPLHNSKYSTSQKFLSEMIHS